MFGGIVEGLGKVLAVRENGTSKIFQIQSPFKESLEAGQSLAHNGVCLTVETYENRKYQINVIRESLLKSNLDSLETGSLINLERSLTLGSYVDGHLVQGHVDGTGQCFEIINNNGSWVFGFEFNARFAGLLVEKGAITINGVSLTAHEVGQSVFYVSIIPYTFYHTNFQYLQKGDYVNLEFDLIGKYVERLGTFNNTRPPEAQ